MIQVAAVDWLPALAMLLAGVLAGSLLVWTMLRRKENPVAESSETLADLAARRDVLLQQLREATDESERKKLEIETARLLRNIDQFEKASPLEVPPARTPLPAPQSAVRGFLWGAGTVAVLALIVVFLTRSTEPRSEGAPVTGEAAQDAGRPEADLARLENAVKQDPADMEARLDLAKAYLMSNQLMQVFEQTQVVLEREPGNPRALSYQALVRLAMGESDHAMQMLRQALDRDPDSLDARVHLALVHATRGELDAARQQIGEASRRHPAERQQLTLLLQQIEAAGRPQAVAAGAAAIPDAPAAGAVSDRVELVVDLASKGKASSGVLFVVARPEGVAEGAPIAVKRVSVAAFPVQVTIGSEDSMMGGRLTERLRIDVRLDSDGDATTKSPGDPAGFIDGVPRGAKAVRVSLR